MEEEDTIVQEKEVLMIPPSCGGLPTLRKARFLKPLFDPSNQHIPKLHSFSVSSKPNISKEMFVFKGMLNPQKSWKMWVKNMQKTHQNTWKKVGIFDAIRASTYNIKKDNELIIRLAENWCPQTNTFIFPWGEATISLEDVMVLGGFSVLGVCVKNIPKNADDQEMQKKLNDSCAKIKKQTNTSNVSHYAWMNHFKGKGGELEHTAFIALWLSRYVFSSSDVFSIAVKLVRGTRVALAPAILASIYRDLSLLKEKNVTLNCEKSQENNSKLVLWAPFQLVQVWAWERFPTLGPEPVPLVHNEPRLARWHGVNTPKIRNFRVEIESAKEEFLWRPYALSVRNWEFPKFYCDQELWMLINSEIDDELLSFARCLRVSELVGMNCVEQYLPHRVAMQFGFDQDIPICIPRLNADVKLAWSSYDKSLDGLKFYLPPRLFEGDVTVQYSDWWRSHEFQTVSKVQRNGLKKMKRLSKTLNEKKDGNSMEVSLQNSEDLICAENSETMQNTVINVLLDNNDKGEPINNGNLSEERPLINPKIIPLFDACVDDVHHKSEKDAETKQMKTSIDDIVVVEDEEENAGFNHLVHFEALCLDFETRIDKLEKMVYALKAAKNRAMVE